MYICEIGTNTTKCSIPCNFIASIIIVVCLCRFEIMSLMEDLILATDVSRHTVFMTQLEVKLKVWLLSIPVSISPVTYE